VFELLEAALFMVWTDLMVNCGDLGSIANLYLVELVPADFINL
jgi:hypothetical protein